MTILSIPAFAMAVIAFYAAGYHFLVYIRQPKSRVNLTFAFTAFSTGLYDIFCVQLYNATSPWEGVQIQRWQLISLCLLSIAFVWFIVDYTSMRSRIGSWFFTCVFLVFGLIGLIDRSGLAWTTQPLVKQFQFPYFGWDITYHEMEFGRAMLLEAFTLMVFYLYLFLVSIHYYWRKNPTRAKPLVLAVGVFLLGMTIDVSVALGYFSFVYTIEYSFMGMILVMAYTLSSEIIERGKIKQDLKESEKMFKAMAETSPLAIYTSVGVEQKAEYINPTFFKLFGYTLKEVPSIKQWWPLAYPDEKYRQQVKEEWQQKIERAIAAESEIEPIEAVVTCKDGSTKNISWGFVAIGEKNWAFGHNLTELKRAEKELKASLKEKETLIQEIHHRVKNNMQIIASLLGLQVDKEVASEVKDVLRDNIGRVYAMSAIHESLYQSEHLSEINFKSYINRLALMLLQTFSIDSNKVTYCIESQDLKLNIEKANPLGLVLNELISNSLKYAFPGERKGIITISLEQLDHQALRLVVMDDGIGMPKDFDWDRTATLGLKLVRTLVEDQLDGSIELKNESGAKFIIKFQ